MEVEGARKVWWTLKTVSISGVVNTIKRLTSVGKLFFFPYNILCIKQRIHKIATEANTSAYPKKMIKCYDIGTLQCKINYGLAVA